MAATIIEHSNCSCNKPYQQCPDEFDIIPIALKLELINIISTHTKDDEATLIHLIKDTLSSYGILPIMLLSNDKDPYQSIFDNMDKTNKALAKLIKEELEKQGLEPFQTEKIIVEIFSVPIDTPSSTTYHTHKQEYLFLV